jgi:hydroxymethylbilane synthase
MTKPLMPQPFDERRLPVRIGSRGSPLALVQARQVAAALRAQQGWPEDAVVITIIKTSGDRIQDRPLSEVGGKGLFTKEIEEALIDNTIDIAVHSMKDVETQLPDGLTIDCLLPREDVRDAFISSVAPNLMGLPLGATIGSSSLRRQAQLKHMRPDLNVVQFRGNVETRLAKLAADEVDATLLAAAGLRRLKMDHVVTELLATEFMLPAVAQGAIGIERRHDDAAIAGLLAPLNDAPTALCVMAERAFLAGLDGSCRTPIAGLAQLTPAGQIRLRGQILRPDGSAMFAIDRSADVSQGVTLGREAAAAIRAQAGPDFLGVS